MKEYIAKTTCFWGPQLGAETIYQKGDILLAHGSEPGLDEFFEPVDAEPEAPKKGKGKAVKDEDDL